MQESFWDDVMDEKINESYFDDKPYSFGGKYRLYEKYGKKYVDNALCKMTPPQDLNNIDNKKTFSPIYVYRKRELF